MASPFVRRALATIVGMAVAVAALEVFVRIRGTHEQEIYDAVYRVPDQCAAEIPYVMKPNLAGAKGRGGTLLNTDSLGLRSSAPGTNYGAKRAGEFRIAIVGDSVTFGEGVRLNEDTFAQVMQRELGARLPDRQTTVFNYGVSAYSVRQMAALLECRMLDVEPDLVVMAIITPDMDVDRTPRALDSHGHFLDLGGGKIGPVGSFVLDLFRSMRLVYSIRWAAFPTWRPRGQQARTRIGRGEVPDSYSYILRFAAFATSRRLPYLIAILPWPVPTEAIVGRLERDRVEFADLSSIRAGFTQEQFRASAFDPHPSAAVHRVMGEKLAAEIVMRLGAH